MLLCVCVCVHPSPLPTRLNIHEDRSSVYLFFPLAEPAKMLLLGRVVCFGGRGRKCFDCILHAYIHPEYSYTNYFTIGTHSAEEFSYLY